MLKVDINFHRPGLEKQCGTAKGMNRKHQTDIRGVFAFTLGKGGNTDPAAARTGPEGAAPGTQRGDLRAGNGAAAARNLRPRGDGPEMRPVGKKGLPRARCGAMSRWSPFQEPGTAHSQSTVA